MNGPPFLVVATPCFGGQVTTAYLHSLLCLQQGCAQLGITFTWLLGSSDALITRARADLTTTFLELAGATHLLFVDADIGFDPNQVFRMLQFGVDVVAGAYPLKAIDYDKLRNAFAEQRPKPEQAGLNYVFALEAASQQVEANQGFAKAKYVGNGFLMIRREAIVKLCEAHPELQFKQTHTRNDARRNSPNRFALFDTMIDRETGEYLPEDYSFCRRWRALGGDIWVDLQSKLTHVGPMRFAGDVGALFDAAPPK
ncbi:MAG TPA: hypothetical protein VGI39_34605 [Polyangiaceae bacterium]